MDIAEASSTAGTASPQLPFRGHCFESGPTTLNDKRALYRDLALAIGGPAALGALLGHPSTPHVLKDFGWVARDALRLPAISIGAAILLAPTLYIGLARLGLLTAGLPAIFRAHRQALARGGLIILGALPAIAFIGLSSWDPATTLWAGLGLGGVAALVAMRDLGTSLAAASAASPGAKPVQLWHRLLFLGWSAVAVTVAAGTFLDGLSGTTP
jgi:hypothetical protein